MASLRELDQRLFESYIELKADPIVGSLEPGIYAGYFDWRDCLPPAGEPRAPACPDAVRPSGVTVGYASFLLA